MSLRKLLPVAIATLAGFQLTAATYYVSPDGAGTKDGSSWENAFDTEAFRVQASNNVNGDIYYLAGGVYYPSETIVFKVETGATLIGNADGERTIFSGDKNGNNNPDNGDASRLIRFQANTATGISTRPIVVENIDFTCVYTVNDTNKDTAPTMGALMIDNSGSVTVKNCNFYGNWAQGQYGGAPCKLYRSSCVFTNCIFRNNSANYRGAAVWITSNSSTKGLATFVNCTFKNNTNYHNLGIIFGDNFKQIDLINCTIAGNKSNGTENAATIFVNPKGNYPNQVTIINSTIAGNTPSQIGFNAAGANFRAVNSIITGAEGTTAIDFAATETFANVISGGYNYVGPLANGADEASATDLATRAEDAVASFWQPTDNVSLDNTYASVFGENKINSNNVIDPIKYIAGASGAQIEAATADWALPAGISLTTDAAGKTRTEGMMPGANSFTEAEINLMTSVINTISNSDNALSLKKIGNGIFAIEGATHGITAYSLTGATVAHSCDNTIDLSALSTGIYILKSGNEIFKVLK